MVKKLQVCIVSKAYLNYLWLGFFSVTAIKCVTAHLFAFCVAVCVISDRVYYLCGFKERYSQALHNPALIDQ